MNTTITEKDYPIQKVWLFKNITPAILVFTLLVMPLIIFSIIAGPMRTEMVEADNDIQGQIWFWPTVILILYITYALRRKFFHYSIADKFISIQQGIISRKHQDVPYEVIQNILVKQDIFDRIFKIASLRIDNASQAGGYLKSIGQQKVFGLTMSSRGRREGELIGFHGNELNIPGLKKDHAETLKGIILQRMKENPIGNSVSGL